MRVFKFALMCVIALVMVGCEAMEPTEGICPDPLPAKPTVPLKKRPIVPTSKLPRPRVAEEYATAEAEVYEAEVYEAEEWEYCEEW
jgi:hypothetical protein